MTGLFPPPRHLPYAGELRRVTKMEECDWVLEVYEPDGELLVTSVDVDVETARAILRGLGVSVVDVREWIGEHELWDDGNVFIGPRQKS